jgi:undecaprenyldiphospho-muramoylpentapeptide beta-N-acetylglucosaminyltransferase
VSPGRARRAGSTRRYAVVAGGGTGGHVLPALAVARALVARGHPATAIELVGSRRGQESVLLADEAFPRTLLGGRGIVRSGDVRSTARNLVALGGAAGAMVRALVLLGRWRPEVVVSVGGYASFPAGMAAVVRRVPLVLVNVDAVPGLVHRLLGPFAAASAVAFPGTALRRAVLTGAPVRAEIEALDRSPAAAAAARAALGIPGRRQVVAAVGGSLGARRINEAVVDLARRWHGRGDLALYHVTGRRDWGRVAAAGLDTREAEGRLFYRPVPYEEHMGRLLEAADLIVARAGAMTVAELGVVGVPAVLVPLPQAPGGHQRENARPLEAAGAAIVVADEECEGGRLAEVIDPLIGDATRLEAMGAAGRLAGRPGAADRTAELVEACAAGRARGA